MLLEINTVPGMTGHSLVPMAARAPASISPSSPGACSRPASRGRGLEHGHLPQAQSQPPEAGEPPHRAAEARVDARGRAAGAVAALAALGAPARGRLLDLPVRSIVDRRPVPARRRGRGAAGGARRADGGFVSADLDRLRSAVEALAWVDRARVRRLWPDRIRIEIVEQQAAARWGEDGLLNTRGELFATRRAPRAAGAAAARRPDGHGGAGRAALSSRSRTGSVGSGCASRRSGSTRAAPGSSTSRTASACGSAGARWTSAWSASSSSARR